MVTEVSAGGVLIDGGDVFVLRKPNGEWVMPKGHLEPDESPEQAAVREVFEETGLKARIVEEIGQTRYHFRLASGEIRGKVVHWYLMTVEAREFRIEPTFEEGVFLAVEDALKVLSFENDRDILRQAMKERERIEAETRPDRREIEP